MATIVAEVINDPTLGVACLIDHSRALLTVRDLAARDSLLLLLQLTDRSGSLLCCPPHATRTMSTRSLLATFRKQFLMITAPLAFPGRRLRRTKSSLPSATARPTSGREITSVAWCQPSRWLRPPSGDSPPRRYKTCRWIEELVQSTVGIPLGVTAVSVIRGLVSRNFVPTTRGSPSLSSASLSLVRIELHSSRFDAPRFVAPVKCL